MNELDLKDVFNIIWGKKIQIILIVAIFVAIGVIYTLNFVTPMYSASTTMILVTSNESETASTSTSVTTSDISLNSQLVGTYSELIKSKTVLRQVLSNLNVDSIDEDELKSNVTVSSKDDTEMISVVVATEDPELSAEIANEIVKVFAEEVKRIYNIDNVNVVDEAEPESEPSNINHKRDVALFAFIGVVAAAGYVFIATLLDTTIKASEDLEREFKIPVLAEIPLWENNNVALTKTKKGGKN